MIRSLLGLADPGSAFTNTVPEYTALDEVLFPCTLKEAIRRLMFCVWEFTRENVNVYGYNIEAYDLHLK